MSERERVIKGLEYGINDEIDTPSCPYYEDGRVDIGLTREVPVNLLRDALALLKAQEARVMTLEEVNALDWDYCYLEQERLPGNEYREMLGKYIMTCVTWPSITAAKISQGMDNYGKTWRCWASRPTDAQREATPWKAAILDNEADGG